MMQLLAQAQPNFWNAESGSAALFLKLGIGLAVGLLAMFALLAAPPQSRKYFVGGLTFLAGLFYVLYFYWPRPIDRDPGEMPRGMVEGVSFWLEDTVATIANFSTILSGFLLGLGIFSIARIHGKNLVRRQKDWIYSLVLLLCMVAIVFFGLADWHSRQGAGSALLADPANWGIVNRGKDFLFDGMFQQMDAAMFSLIAFFIISAAYRAFRVRSIEATILLATALIMILSLMGVVQYVSEQLLGNFTGGNPDAFANNLTLSSVAGWISNNVQTPAIRGIDFGIGIGALAMGLRLWLSLEKAGGNG
jgi:hypothetical protein